MTALTPEQRAELLDETEANMLRGASKISRGDESVEFRSLSETRQLINEERAKMAPARSRQAYPTFSKGTD